jgi:hypothetical protein
MSQIKIKIDNGCAALTAPYNPDFPARAKQIGGRWNSSSKDWTFDARDADRVRALCREVYGEDDSPADLVTVRIRYAIPNPNANPEQSWTRLLTQSELNEKDTWWLFGRQIARQIDRDGDPRLGDGVVVVQGTVTGGGSRKNPRLHASEDLILEIRDVPRAAIVKLRGAEGSENCRRSEIVAPASSPTPREQAIAKIRALFDQIDALMGEHGITVPEVR